MTDGFCALVLELTIAWSFASTSAMHYLLDTQTYVKKKRKVVH
jgi:hypothetical protein